MYFCMFSKFCNIFHCTCFKQVLSKFIWWKLLQKLCLSTVLVEQDGIITEKSFYKYYCYSFFNSPGKINYFIWCKLFRYFLALGGQMFRTVYLPQLVVQGTMLTFITWIITRLAFFCKYQVFIFGMIIIAVFALA